MYVSSSSLERKVEILIHFRKLHSNQFGRCILILTVFVNASSLRMAMAMAIY